MSTPASSAKVIIVGGGLAGLSAAHTVLERGGRVLVLDKNGFLGGNSTKATSGINGTLTRTQIAKDIKDSTAAFERDTALSASKGKSDKIHPLGKVMVAESGAAVEWLMDAFGLNLSLVSRLGGHSFPRTHRGPEKFPGMTITYALMEALEKVAETQPHRARVVFKARVNKLIKDESGAVVGVEYEKDGKQVREDGPVVLATGGYCADFSKDSVLMKYRPDVAHLPTTNGEHASGDGIRLAEAVGAGLVDMEAVQVHPTGMVLPSDPNAKVKFLAAEALRGVGGIMLDATGKRFCDELGRRDYVSGEMFKGKGPFRLVLNSLGAKEIAWHAAHYVGRGLMKHFKNGAELAAEIGVPVSTIEETFRAYNEAAKNNKCPFGKKFFQNAPFRMDDDFHVAIITPVLHYSMGGLHTSTEGAVCTPEGKPIPGLFCTGEVMGGTHGLNRLGGSSLLDCVAFGRVSGRSVASYLFDKTLDSTAGGAAQRRLGAIAGQVAGITVRVDPASQSVTIGWGEGAPAGAAAAAAPAAAAAAAAAPAAAAAAAPAAAAAAPAAAAAAPASAKYTLAEVAKHNTEADCWVVVAGKVLNVTKFLADHPGGKQAILLFAGKDATEEFNMLHDANVIEKYAAYTVIGTLA